MKKMARKKISQKSIKLCIQLVCYTCPTIYTQQCTYKYRMLISN